MPTGSLCIRTAGPTPRRSEALFGAAWPGCHLRMSPVPATGTLRTTPRGDRNTSVSLTHPGNPPQVYVKAAAAESGYGRATGVIPT